MSREEAIKVLKEYLVLDEDIDNEYLEAQRVAIEALEEQENPNSIRINFVGEEEAKEFNEYLKNQQPKESVLDKIRDEAKELDGKYLIGDYGIYGENIPKYVRLWDVLQIIDKYKSESEVKE